jgi:hypothetical protein
VAGAEEGATCGSVLLVGSAFFSGFFFRFFFVGSVVVSCLSHPLSAADPNPSNTAHTVAPREHWFAHGCQFRLCTTTAYDVAASP